MNSQLQIQHVQEEESDREEGEGVVRVRGVREQRICIMYMLCVADNFQRKGHVWLSALNFNDHLLTLEDK